MKIGHGSIPLEFGYGPFKTKVTVYGGPIMDAPKGMIAVNLRKEAPEYGTVQFPIKDFSTPKAAATADFLEALLPDVIEKGEVYIGCAGGTGRTGLMLALLSRLNGEQHPVRYVRANYKRGAVETEDQRLFVNAFPSNWLEAIQKDANRRGVKRYFTSFFR